MKRRTVFFLFTGIILFSSCYEECKIYPDLQKSCLNFSVTPWQEYLINHSRGTKLSFNDTLPILCVSNQYYKIDQFSLRGENTLNFRRKSFSVNLDDNIFLLIEPEDQALEIEEFKLISLVFDYTYIENSIAIGLFRKLNLWPVYSAYTEVRLNNHTQGLYLFIEDPVEHFFLYHGSDIVFRRGYHNNIDAQYLNDTRPIQPTDFYTRKFYSIYSYLADYSGKTLYDSIASRLDITQYFKKLSVDMLLQNGDYTEEIFFYYNHQGVFGIFPWDYDDIFAEAPHEIGRNWGTGTIFGSRSYNSVEDVIADVGVKLLFSIEDDLDYAIARDPYLYQKYLSVLENVLDTLDVMEIQNMFDDTREQLARFYLNDSIISQSIYDEHATNHTLFESNLKHKKDFLINRRNWLVDMVSQQKE